jgi:GAF domain-containing protein/HAMP domain-containing protein
VVDATGRLIAHPDISLVLRNTDMSQLAQVKSARAAGAGNAAEPVQEAADIDGHKVLTASALVAPLGWHVFVETPIEEAYAPLYAAIERTALVLLGALALAFAAGMFLARRMVVPIQALRTGAARLGSGDLGQRIAIKTGDEVEALADQFNDMAGRLQESYADLEHKVDVRTQELTESLEQQTATSEVLQVISSSPGDLKPVFAAMLENAVRICDSKFGNIYRWDSEFLHLLAAHNSPPALVEHRQQTPYRPHPNAPMGRMVATKRLVHVADAAAEEAYVERREPGITAAVELGGIRTYLIVPMLKENELIGVFTVFRQEVRPFTDKQIEFVQNFAAQAVIAIENARLLAELRESLEQQTATADVLRVISSSPGDLKPVFAAMLENAARICGANFGNIFRWENDALHLVASHNLPPAYAKIRGSAPFRPPPASPTARMIETKSVTEVADLAAEQAYAERDPVFVEGVEIGGIRTLLSVPMLKEDKLVGAFTLYRQEVRPFADKQVALVSNFANQAVIAIENARLLSELRESLAQQTATADVLRVISSSPGDLKPVFAAMLENAVRICEASFGNMYLWDGRTFDLTANFNTPSALVEYRKRSPVRPTPENTFGRVLATKAYVQVADLANAKGYLEGDPSSVASVELGGIRTLAVVPMLKDDELIGLITVYRQEGTPIFREADRARSKLRRPGRHRHRERPPAQRAEAVIGAADRYRRSSWRDLKLEIRAAAHSAKRRGYCGAALSRRSGGNLPAGRRSLPLRSRLQSRSGIPGIRAPHADCSWAGNTRRPRRTEPPSRPDRRCLDRPAVRGKRIGQDRTTSLDDGRAAHPRCRGDWRHRLVACSRRTVFRPRNRAGDDFRRSGGHCHRKRTAVRSGAAAPAGACRIA